MPARFTLVPLLVLALVGRAADAQETRAAELRAKRQAKADQVKPPERAAAERFLFQLEDRLWVERILTAPRGVYLRLGGVGEGSGFGAGPAYRYRTGTFDFKVSAAGSLKRYVIAEASLLLPGAVGNGPFVELHVRRRDFPQEDFFGLGPASLVEERSNFALRDTLARVTGGLRAGGFTAGVTGAHLDPAIGRGTDTRMPSTDVLFAAREVPGLSEQPAFAFVEPFAEYSYGYPPLNPASGGRYRVSWTRYSDRDLDSFSFTRWDADLRQYIPFFRRTRTIALRALLSSSSPDEGHEVPFYLQPTLGGGYTLRGFRSFRFRDRSLALLQAEYRWRINEFVTGAMFYDTGAVGGRLGDLGGFEKDFGIGLRAGPPGGVAFRAEVVFGSGEGTRLLVRFDNVF